MYLMLGFCYFALFCIQSDNVSTTSAIMIELRKYEEKNPLPGAKSAYIASHRSFQRIYDILVSKDLIIQYTVTNLPSHLAVATADGTFDVLALNVPCRGISAPECARDFVIRTVASLQRNYDEKMESIRVNLQRLQERSVVGMKKKMPVDAQKKRKASKQHQQEDSDEEYMDAAGGTSAAEAANVRRSKRKAAKRQSQMDKRHDPAVAVHECKRIVELSFTVPFVDHHLICLSSNRKLRHVHAYFHHLCAKYSTAPQDERFAVSLGKLLVAVNPPGLVLSAFGLHRVVHEIMQTENYWYVSNNTPSVCCCGGTVSMVNVILQMPMVFLVTNFGLPRSVSTALSSWLDDETGDEPEASTSTFTSSADVEG